MNIKSEAILVMDFGGQYAQLIARRVREQNVYCEIKSYKTTAEEIKEQGYKGVIFQEVLTVYMLKMHQSVTPLCLKAEYLYWVFAMEPK